MKRGEWYKEYGQGRHQTYFKIRRIDEDLLTVEHLLYDTLTEHFEVIRDETVPAREWMERELRNEVHSVPREDVPFLSVL